MKKKMMVLGSALVILATASTAVQAQDYKRYIGVNAGTSKMEFSSYSMGSDTNMGVTFGFLASDSHEARLGYTKFGTFKGSDVSSMHGDVLFKHAVMEQGEIIGGIGVGSLKFDTDSSYTVRGQTVNSKSSKTEFSYRASIGYRHHFGRFSVQGEGQYVGGIGKTAKDIKLTNFVVGANVAF